MTEHSPPPVLDTTHIRIALVGLGIDLVALALKTLAPEVEPILVWALLPIGLGLIGYGIYPALVYGWRSLRRRTGRQVLPIALMGLGAACFVVGFLWFAINLSAPRPTDGSANIAAAITPLQARPYREVLLEKTKRLDPTTREALTQQLLRVSRVLDQAKPIRETAGGMSDLARNSRANRMLSKTINQIMAQAEYLKKITGDFHQALAEARSGDFFNDQMNYIMRQEWPSADIVQDYIFQIDRYSSFLSKLQGVLKPENPLAEELITPPPFADDHVFSASHLMVDHQVHRLPR